MLPRRPFLASLLALFGFRAVKGSTPPKKPAELEIWIKPRPDETLFALKKDGELLFEVSDTHPRAIGTPSTIVIKVADDQLSPLVLWPRGALSRMASDPVSEFRPDEPYFRVERTLRVFGERRIREFSFTSLHRAKQACENDASERLGGAPVDLAWKRVIQAGPPREWRSESIKVDDGNLRYIITTS